MAEMHKRFHYFSDIRKHQSLWFLVQGYKNNIDLLYNSREVQVDQLLLSQSSRLFSKNFPFNGHSKLSLSFLDSLSATLFLLELIYDAWTHICFLVRNSQNSFRSKCTISLGAFCQAKVVVSPDYSCSIIYHLLKFGNQLQMAWYSSVLVEPILLLPLLVSRIWLNILLSWFIFPKNTAALAHLRIQSFIVWLITFSSCPVLFLYKSSAIFAITAKEFSTRMCTFSNFRLADLV